MSDVKYRFENPPQWDATGGDPETGKKWGVQYEDQRLINYNGTLAKIEADMNLLRSLVGVSGSDTLKYRWASEDAIIVEPGMAIASDGTTLSIANETTLTLTADLDTGTRQANSIYFVWIGKDTISGDTKLKLSLSYDTPPTSLVTASAYRLRHFFNTNTGNANIEQFCEPLPDAWPPGMYTWDGAHKPAGCHWPYGQTVSRTHLAYARLFAHYGYLPGWGVGDGSTTFQLPDTRGRSPMGAGHAPGLSPRNLGEYIGEEAHIISEAEMPRHSHGMKVSWQGPAGGGSGQLDPASAIFHSTELTGWNSPHNTIHPSFVLYYILKG